MGIIELNVNDVLNSIAKVAGVCGLRFALSLERKSDQAQHQSQERGHAANEPEWASAKTKGKSHSSSLKSLQKDRAGQAFAGRNDQEVIWQSVDHRIFCKASHAKYSISIVKNRIRLDKKSI
jgi:hypothetical protein